MRNSYETLFCSAKYAHSQATGRKVVKLPTLFWRFFYNGRSRYQGMRGTFWKSGHQDLSGSVYLLTMLVNEFTKIHALGKFGKQTWHTIK